MKNKEKNKEKISLDKFVIAKLDSKAQRTVIGGGCHPVICTRD